MKIADKSDLENVKEALKNGNGTTRPDDSRVIIAEMQINALTLLAEDNNQIFSQLSSGEVFDVARAYVFAESPLLSINQRLKEKNLDYNFKLPLLTHVLDENIRHRHKIDRKRVKEYLDGLLAITPKQTNMFANEDKKGIMGRLI
jgi:hypothetical protein